MSPARNVDEGEIVDALDGSWRTIAEIRGKLGRSPAIEIATKLQRMAEAGKIEETSETIEGTRRNGKLLKILSYRRRSE